LTGTACAVVHESSSVATAAKKAILNNLSRMVLLGVVIPVGTEARWAGWSKRRAMPGECKRIKDLREFRAAPFAVAAKRSVAGVRRR
jgi:hypothetical protein